MLNKVILSLFDYSGNWVLPYRQNGYPCIQINIKYGHDVFDDSWLNDLDPDDVYGILAAPPCDNFAVSGARWFKDKDLDGRTEYSIKLIKRTLEIIKKLNPKFYAIENPVGRINRLIPEMKELGPRYFQPYFYGDFYSKKTGLWGRFNFPEPTNMVEPIRSCPQGSHLQRLGGKSEKTKMLRSITPMGFCRAFYESNQ